MSARIFQTPSSHLKRLQANLLAISVDHALKAGALPLHHRDPFDQMLIAQAQHENISIISNDEAFEAYDVELL